MGLPENEQMAGWHGIDAANLNWLYGRITYDLFSQMPKSERVLSSPTAVGLRDGKPKKGKNEGLFIPLKTK